MPFRDTYSRNDVVALLVPEVITVDTNTSSIDMQGRNTLLIAVNVGLSADTLSGTDFLSIELEESDDDVVFNAVADKDMANPTTNGSGQFGLIDDPAEDETVVINGYRGSKQYVRVVLNVNGTFASGMPVGAIAIAETNNQPANNTTFAG